MNIDLSKVDYDTDVLVIGGGGAGCSAAIEADNAGAKVMIVTKLRAGDANTMMAEGGIQAADKENDSPVQHFLDAYGGGHFAAKRELVEKLVMEAPDAIKWLNDLGVMFDKAPDGTMITTHGGGTSRKRMHACKDYSGAEIMRTLRDEVQNRQIPVIEFTSAVELIKDSKGQVAGAVLLNMETGDYLVARAKALRCCIRIQFSIIRPELHSRLRFRAHWSPRRFVLSAHSLSTKTELHIFIRWKPAMSPRLVSSVSARADMKVSRHRLAMPSGSIPR